MDNSSNKYTCSFCKKTQTQVNRLIAGPEKVFICDQCVKLCSEMLSNSKSKELNKYSKEELLNEISYPISIKSELDDLYLKYDDNLSNWSKNTDDGRKSGSTIQNSDGNIESRGFEVNSNYKPNKDLLINIGYTFTDAYDGEDCDDPDYAKWMLKTETCNDDMPVRVPRHAINAKINKTINKTIGINISLENNISDSFGKSSLFLIRLSIPLPKDDTTNTWGNRPINVPKK